MGDVGESPTCAPPAKRKWKSMACVHCGAGLINLGFDDLGSTKKCLGCGNSTYEPIRKKIHPGEPGISTKADIDQDVRGHDAPGYKGRTGLNP